MLIFILGACGTGKTSSMINFIKNSYEQGTNNYVIVPDQFSFEYDKKMYNLLGARYFNNIESYSFSRLTRDIFIKYGGLPGEYADDLTKIAIMQLAINKLKEENKFLFYQKQYKKNDFVTNILDVIKELKWSDVSLEDLQDKLDSMTGDIHDKTSDILSIYKAYEKLLIENNKKDSLNDVVEASKIAFDNSYFCNSNVFIDEFQTFSKNEYSLLEVIIKQSKNTYISLPIGDNSSLFAFIEQTYNSLVEIAKSNNIPIRIIKKNEKLKYKNLDIAHLSENVFSRKLNEKISSDNVKTYQSDDVYSECDFVATEIKHLILEKKYRYNDILVVTKNIKDYSSIIETSFIRYDIPVFLDFEKPISHKSIVILIKSIFEISLKRFPDTESILRYLKTGFLGLSIEEISDIENFVYKWSIEGKLWLEPFEVSDNNSDLENIRKKIIEPLVNFKNKTKKSTGKEICLEVFKLLKELKIEENITSFTNEDESELLVQRETKQVWNIIIDIFEKMCQVMGNSDITLADFYNTFCTMINQSLFSTPPQQLDNVILSSNDRARLGSPKAIFILGVNDGQFPFNYKQSGLFNQQDRENLCALGIKLEKNISYMASVEKFVCYTALSAPTEKIYCTYSLTDVSGKNQFPSYIINSITRLFSNNIFYKVSDISPIYFCTTTKATYYTYIQQYENKNRDFFAIKDFLCKDKYYKERINQLENMTDGTNFRIKKNNLTKELFGEKLYLSSSRFEDYSKCPFLYFCKKGLNLSAEDKIEINHMQTGNIIHYCIFKILKKYAKDDFIKLDKDCISLDVNGYLKEYYEKSLGGNFAKTEKFSFLYSKIADILSEIIIHLQKELMQSQFVPAEFEYKTSSSPIEFVLPDGLKIYFSGTVDRVDIADINNTKYLRVIDYKSGEKEFKLDDVCFGINMQMLLYLFLLTSNGKYKNYSPAGILYMPTKDIKLFGGRNDSIAQIEDLKNKEFKMNGLIIEKDDVIKAMEENINGIFIPIKAKKSGEYMTSSIISEQNIIKLEEYCKSLIIDMAEDLYGGNVSASPISKDGKKLPCEYCDYQSVCGRTNNKDIRLYDADKISEFKKLIGSEKNVKQVDQ